MLTLYLLRLLVFVSLFSVGISSLSLVLGFDIILVLDESAILFLFTLGSVSASVLM